MYGQKTTHEYENNASGFEEFMQTNALILPESLCVLEATGGNEMSLIYALVERNYAVHRADARKVKNFIRSFGSQAKTDTLDAKAIAHYGKERATELALFLPSCTKTVTLFQLVQRRSDLKAMLVAEKNRFQAPSLTSVKVGIKKIILL